MKATFFETYEPRLRLNYIRTYPQVFKLKDFENWD